VENECILNFVPLFKQALPHMVCTTAQYSVYVKTRDFRCQSTRQQVSWWRHAGRHPCNRSCAGRSTNTVSTNSENLTFTWHRHKGL